MKLAAIYNTWSDQELLNFSIKKIRPLVDGIIVVYSTQSNYGELDANFDFEEDIIYERYEPILSLSPRQNETDKRNAGIDCALENGFTHFIMMDTDEVYDHKEFIKEKERFNDLKLQGLVCRSKVYFKSPTLTIGYDTTLVPFIHKLTTEIKCEFNRNYPFAWTDTDGVPFTPKKRIRIDPTRSLNITSGVEWSDITMHHFSYVRSDLNKKIRNSTARDNIQNSTIFRDYAEAKPGYFCNFYGKVLQECPNVFGFPELIDVNVSQGIQHSKEPTKATGTT